MNYSTNALKDGAMFPGREGFRARSHSSHDERAGHRQETPVRVQSESVRVSLSQTTLSYSSSSSNINMDQFYQELSARMGLPSSPSADSSKLNSTYTANGASYVKVPPISAEKVAENILGFVERRLTQMPSTLARPTRQKVPGIYWQHYQRLSRKRTAASFAFGSYSAKTRPAHWNQSPFPWHMKTPH